MLNDGRNSLSVFRKFIKTQNAKLSMLFSYVNNQTIHKVETNYEEDFLSLRSFYARSLFKNFITPFCVRIR